jgi:hypothetical protein
VTFNKFGAVKTLVNGILFDSKLESATYERLLTLFPSPQFNIKTQFPIEVKPRSQGFPSIFWKVDFCILENDKPILYVEAKGTLTRDFKLLMKFLEYRDPILYSKIILVVSRSSNISSYKSLKIHTINLDRDFSKNIHKFFQGKRHD